MNAKREITERVDPKQQLVEMVIGQLEQGRVPWKREWDVSKCAGPQAPFNPVTKHFYRGVNILALACHPLAFETADPRWTTFLQAKDMGWNIRKGSKATTIFFAKPLTVRDRDSEEDATKEIHLLRAYSVFHASQIEKIPDYKPPTMDEAPWTRPEAVEIILKNCGAALRIGGSRAFYAPNLDLIQLPPDVAFSSREYWAATAVHEVGHSTGHSTRMHRDLSGAFGSEKYASEESRVEMAAAFTCNTLNLPTDYENHAAYIATWLTKIRADHREVFRCAADAQRISDYVLAMHPEYAAQHQPDRPTAEPQTVAPNQTL